MRRQRERGRSDRAYVVINGKRHKLGVWGSEKAEARYRELVAGLESGEASKPLAVDELPPSARLTVVEVMAPFMRHVVEWYPDNEAEVWHYKAAMRILKQQFGGQPADEFGPRRLRAVRDEMVAKGWSRKYVNGQVNRVRRLFLWAVGEELLPGSAYQALTAVEGLRVGRTKAPEPEKVAPVSDADIAATMPFLNPVVADMVQIQGLCGCRPGELCRMAAEFIDRSGEVWLFELPKHKTRHHGKQRVIALGPKAQAILRKYLFRDGEFFPYTTDTYRQVIRRACKRAGVQRWRPNQIRHTTATKVRAEHGIEGAQHVLGHARADVTQIYAERNAEQASAIAKAMG